LGVFLVISYILLYNAIDLVMRIMRNTVMCRCWDRYRETCRKPTTSVVGVCQHSTPAYIV